MLRKCVQHIGTNRLVELRRAQVPGSPPCDANPPAFVHTLKSRVPKESIRPAREPRVDNPRRRHRGVNKIVGGITQCLGLKRRVHVNSSNHMVSILRRYFLTTVRLKLEQIQLVSGVEFADVRAIGLQGA